MNDAESAILGLVQVQHGALSRQQALAAGLSPSAIARRLATGEWVRLFQGAYRLGGSECTFEQRVMAGTLAGGDGAVASHRAAAALFGMPGAPRWVEITVPRTSRVELEGVIAHRTRLLAPEDVARLKGIPVTTAGRTIADLARIYPATKVGQACLFRGLRDAGLPLPVAQYRVLMPDASEVFLDFAYPDVLLAIEADSYLWHASLADWQRDRARNNELVALGWSILPITWDLVTRSPAEAARQVRSARESRLALIR